MRILVRNSVVFVGKFNRYQQWTKSLYPFLKIAPARRLQESLHTSYYTIKIVKKSIQKVAMSGAHR